MREPVNQYKLSGEPVEKTCAFTGHRPDKITGGSYDEDHESIQWVKQQLLDAINEVIGKYKVTSFISGMAIGVDTWAAETVLYLRDEEDIPVELIAAVPFKGQEGVWPEESKKRYWDILERVDKPVLVNKGGYAGWKMHKRNEYMVEESDMLIAVHNGTEGGTENCLRLAAAQGDGYPVYLIDPKERTCEWL